MSDKMTRSKAGRYVVSDKTFMLLNGSLLLLAAAYDLGAEWFIIMVDVIMLLAFFSFTTAAGAAVAVWANHRSSEAVAARKMHEMNQAAKYNPEEQEAAFESYLRRINAAKTTEELDWAQSDLSQMFPEINHEGQFGPTGDNGIILSA